MGDLNYRPLIEDMVWSYSRISCFHQCKYKWFLKYIRGMEETPQFYAQYGKFMHRLLELYYKEILTKDELKIRFLLDFSKEVEGDRPSEKIVQSYIQKGADYLETFNPFPYSKIDVEVEGTFNIRGIPFVGYIDYLGKSDEGYIIIDNKSRDLKERSGRKKPTKKDEELDEMLKQLYIYSAMVHQEYGEFPKYLCFNCFKNGTFIAEPFDKHVYENTMEWVEETVEEIKNESDFRPSVEYFGCRYLCGFSDSCEYLQNS